MNEVNLNQLYTVCNLYLECEFPYFEELREAFHVLNICGCRIEELFQIDRWTYVNGDTVTLQPQKNNLPRTIVLNEHTQTFKNCIINQTKPFLGRTSYQLQYLFRKLNPYRPIYSGGREITLYVYRYKHIWEAQAAGFSIEEIRIEMGHRTQTPILLYLNADLNSTYYIEPYNQDPLPADHIDIITEPLIFTGADSYLIFDNPIVSSQYSIHCKITNPLDAAFVVVGPYNYNLAEKSIHMPFSNSQTSLIGRLYIVQSYTTPSNTGYSLINNEYFGSYTFVVSESLIESGKYLSGSINIKFFQKGLFQRDITFFYQYYPKINASKLVANGRRSSSGIFQNQFRFTLNSLYFWNRLLSDDEILKLANL